MKEHLAHSASCHWAQAVFAGVSAQQEDRAVAQDPMQEDLLAARRGTFEHGAGWPHESKRGWKCKVQRMVEAGWCFDPAPVTSGEEDEGDGVTCFYCNLSLDGWEPKDDPMQEHQKRSPECAFFALGGGVTKKGKAGSKKGARSSTASKASRLSTQSSLSEMASVVDSLGDDVTAGMDDSTISTATTASQATVTGAKKGGKKGAKAKGTAKGGKGRKRAGTVDSQQADDERLYRDLNSQPQISTQPEATVDESQPTEPPKKGERGRPSKQAVDSSVVEVSAMHVAPPKKATRGRKAKAPQSEPRSQVEDVSAQIQEELEHSLDLAGQDFDQSTPQAVAPKEKRGVKRTSDGLQKRHEEESDVSAMAVEFPVPPKPAPAAKGKRGRKPSKQVQQAESDVEASSQQVQPLEVDASMSEVEASAKAPKGKKGAAKGGKAAGSRKASSTRSSSRARGSQINRDVEPAVLADARPEDLDRDEREIEAELARMTAEQATATAITDGMADIQIEQEKAAEYEKSPSSHHEKHVQAVENLEEELQAEVQGLSQPGENMRDYIKQAAKPSMSSMPGAFSPPPLSEASPPAAQQQPSPSGSDKENVPSSAIQPKSAAKPSERSQAPPVVLSPTKTVRVPLAPSTPNKNPLSPSKRGGIALSPSKQPLGPLTSAIPWIPADLDELLMASPQPTPGTLATRLAATAGALTSPEKGLTVEDWVRWNAGKAEEELRRKCEGLVGRFEGEGNRALGVLEGLDIVG